MADQGVKQWFDFIDNDSNGRVSSQELQRALSRGGLHFSLQTVARMIGMYDRSGAGSVNFEEFNQLHQFIVQTQNDFRMIDHNKDGLLSKQEVSDALSRAGFNISQPAFEALFTAYDPDRNQQLSMTEFLGLTLFLRSASGMFQGFAQGASSITLTFDQFVYAACHCRYDHETPDACNYMILTYLSRWGSVGSLIVQGKQLVDAVEPLIAVVLTLQHGRDAGAVQGASGTVVDWKQQ